MIIELKQTEKDLYSGKFIIRREKAKIGKVSFEGSIGSMDIAIKGEFYGVDFSMQPKRRAREGFRPYKISIGGTDFGSVYQTCTGGFLRKIEFIKMIKDKQVFEEYPIAFGKRGSKAPVFRDGYQIAEVDKNYVVYNDLHEYTIYAVDDESAIVSIIFSLYSYANCCYKPGIKSTDSVSKTFYTTTNKKLKSKYDPAFVERINK